MVWPHPTCLGIRNWKCSWLCFHISPVGPRMNTPCFNSLFVLVCHMAIWLPRSPRGVQSDIDQFFIEHRVLRKMICNSLARPETLPLFKSTSVCVYNTRILKDAGETSPAQVLPDFWLPLQAARHRKPSASRDVCTS